MPSIDLLLRTIAPRAGRAWHGGVTPVGAVRGIRPAPPDRADEGSRTADRLPLKAEHEGFAKALRRFPEGRLNRRPPAIRKWSYGDLIAGVLAHDAYHTGQIQLLKRLWKRG